MHKARRAGVPMLLCIAALGSSASRPHTASPRPKHDNLERKLSNSSRGTVERLAGLPLHFEPNVGQADAATRYLSRGRGYTLLLGDTGATMLLRAKEKRHAVRINTVGGKPQVAPSGFERLPGVSNYFVGSDRSRWRTDVPHYARVNYKGVYPGIDLTYYGNGAKLEYDFIVAPGADPSRIELAYEGVDSMHVDGAGDLVLRTALGDVRQHRPVAYQEIGGKRVAVDAQYRLAGGSVRLNLASYNAKQPLVIDPVIGFSTLLGGAGYDAGVDIASNGNGIYVTGTTTSLDFPVAGAYDNWANGSTDIFLARFNGLGTALLSSTFIGGRDVDTVTAMAIGSGGEVYLAGSTSSFDFPLLSAFDEVLYQTEGFVLKLNATASVLHYSTFLGGTGTEWVEAIDVDAAGSAYVAGATTSIDFPLLGALQERIGGGSYYNTDSFVAKLTPAGNALVYSTYFGGSGDDRANTVAVDSAGALYFGGQTTSAELASTNMFSYVSETDGFVAKLNPAGNSLQFFTYLGGWNYDGVTSLALHTSGLYVSGFTNSPGFPLSNPMNAIYGGNTDAFVLKIVGNTLAFSTFLGGQNYDFANDLTVDSAGSVYVAGYTQSPDFPLQSAWDSQSPYNKEGFVAQFHSSGVLGYSTYLGGQDEDEVTAIKAESTNSVLVTGSTRSRDFPLAYASDSNVDGYVESFVARLQLEGAPVPVTIQTNPPGLTVTVDGRTAKTPHTFQWQAGSAHILSVSGSQALGANVYSFSSWSNGGSAIHNLNAPGAPTVYTANFTGQACTYTVTPATIDVGGSAGSFAVNVSVNPYQCTWTASSSSPWITSASTPTFGYGSAIFAFTASGPSRTGTVVVAGRTITVNQIGSNCATLSINSPSATVSGDYPYQTSTSVTAAAGCNWTVSTETSWLEPYVRIGTGNGYVNFRVRINPGDSRVGTAIIGGKTFTVTQSSSVSPGLATGVFRAGRWMLDKNKDAVLSDLSQYYYGNNDLSFQYTSTPGDLPITGDWDGDGQTSTGVFRNGTWILDVDGNGYLYNINTSGGDRIFQYSSSPGDVPVTGDWNGDGYTDTGVFRNGAWFLDYNGDGILTNVNQPGGDRVFQYSATPGDIPVTGDWNGDGKWDTGVFRGGVWFLDVNGDGQLTNVNQPGGDRIFQYSATAGDIPVTGDWNGDHRYDTAIFRNGTWFLDYNGDGALTFGPDRIFQYTATAGDLPVAGKW